MAIAQQELADVRELETRRRCAKCERPARFLLQQWRIGQIVLATRSCEQHLLVVTDEATFDADVAEAVSDDTRVVTVRRCAP